MLAGVERRTRSTGRRRAPYSLHWAGFFFLAGGFGWRKRNWLRSWQWDYGRMTVQYRPCGQWGPMVQQRNTVRKIHGETRAQGNVLVAVPAND